MADSDIPPLTPIDSSMLSAHHYNPNTRQMTVQFKGGAVYQYDDVPIEKHTAFTGALSPGRYFNDRIKATHASRRLNPGK